MVGTELDSRLHNGIATGSCIVAGLGRCVRSEDDISVVCFCKAQLNCVKCQVGALPTPFCTLHFRLRTPHSTLPHCTPHTHTTHCTLCTLPARLRTPQSTLHSPHAILCTPHFTTLDSTLYFTLHTPHSTLHTLHYSIH